MSDPDKTVVPDQQTALDKTRLADAPAGGPSEKPAAKKAVTQLGDFQLVKKLGQGGMGTVYLATQLSLDRKVALKTLSPEFAKRPDFVERFLRECRSMARLQHPNVVQVYAAESKQGAHYAAIEYIDGRSMQSWLNDLGRLEIGDALHVVLVCADALKHAHAQNMIHRDIKPDNILVTSRGVVKVADFGLAKVVDEDTSLTQSGTGMGTPLYMAPEQARNAKHVDWRTDIYALGCTLYHFLTGELPFRGEDTITLILAKEKGTFKSAKKLRPEIPERLDLMIDKMLAKDPSARYADCGELMRDLAGLNLAGATLSFIDSPEKATLSIGGSPSSITAQARTAGGASGTKPGTKSGSPSQSRAAMTQTGQGALDKTVIAGGQSDMWEVRHKSARGTEVTSNLSTDQILRGLKAGALDLSARVRRPGEGRYMPLAQFPEFASKAHAIATQAKAEKRGRDLKETYEQLGRQHDRRKFWRKVKSLFQGVKGLISLILYLGVLTGVAFGCWYAYKHFTADETAPTTPPAQSAPAS
jgi:serine/threonine-protein kinase